MSHLLICAISFNSILASLPLPMAIPLYPTAAFLACLPGPKNEGRGGPIIPLCIAPPIPTLLLMLLLPPLMLMLLLLLAIA